MPDLPIVYFLIFESDWWILSMVGELQFFQPEIFGPDILRLIRG